MKCLIIGGGGQLGMEWEEFCSKNSIIHKSFGSKDLDITNFASTNAILEAYLPDVVINCAAYTKVDLAEDEKEQAFLINSEAVKNLSSTCKSLNIKLVHYSTDYVFSGTSEHLDLIPEGFSEDSDTKAVNVYGVSKLEGEKAIQETSCDFLILRVSWLCGKFGNNFVKTMLKLAETRNELNVVNDQYGSPTFTENVVQNTWTLIQANEQGIFNISSEGLCTWFDFATEIFKIKGMELKVHPVTSDAFPTSAKRPNFSKLSTKKISKIESANIEEWKTGLQKLLNQLN